MLSVGLSSLEDCIIFFYYFFNSVGVPFAGDTLGLDGNANWLKVKAKQEDRIELNMAESITKINRANAKVSLANYFSINVTDSKFRFQQ